MAKTVQDQLDDARAAERLLADDVFQAACNAVEREAIAQWRNSRTGETAIREAAYHTLLALTKIKEQLTVTKDNGAIARKQLADEALRNQSNQSRRQ